MEKSPALAAALFAQDKPFAVLVPSDLDPGLTWLLRIDGVNQDVIMSVEVESNTDRARWVVLQKKEEKMWRKQFGEHVITRPDGLMMLAPPGDSAKILVPRAHGVSGTHPHRTCSCRFCSNKKGVGQKLRLEKHGL